MSEYKKLLIFFYILFVILLKTEAQGTDKHIYSVAKTEEIVGMIHCEKDTVISKIFNGKTIKDSAKLYGNGSSVLINYKDEIYILTAAHVQEMVDNFYKQGATVTFVIPDSIKPNIISLSSILKKEKWKIHPKADLAVIRIASKKSKDFNYWKSHSLMSDRILFDSLPYSTLNQTEVFTFGYPIYDVYLKNFYPLCFKSRTFRGLLNYPRAEDPIKQRIQAFLLTQTPSYQGISGGPVFLNIRESGMNMFYGDGEIILIGIVHGTSGDNTGGKVSLISPTFYLKDLLPD